MIKSENIAKLTEALSKAQAIIEGAKKDSVNPYFQKKYADLASVWEACRKPLTDNGLAVFQTATFIPEYPDMVAIETTLSHSSGEFITGLMAAKPTKADPQSIGSCITYLRRYSLAAICGVSPEDDDGAAASGTKVKVTREKREPADVKVYGLKNTEKDVPENVGTLAIKCPDTGKLRPKTDCDKCPKKAGCPA
jgi:hypothetical protein